MSSTQTYYNRTAKDPALFDSLRSFVATIADKVVEKRVGKIKQSVSNEERIGQLFGRALALTEKAITKVEAMGDEASLEQLMSMHKEIGTWAAKYTVSEAPKRIQVNGQVEHVHLLADETVDRLTRSLERAQTFGLLAGEVLEADVVA